MLEMFVGGFRMINKEKILNKAEKILEDYSMYAEMNEDEFWKSSTISPQEARNRVKYVEKFLEELKEDLE